MTQTVIPEYYTRLAPFRKLFETGLPILTYHKFGPRPRNARLRGLYLSERLFRRQLSELRGAGFRLGPVQRDAIRSQGDRQVVITIDDGFRSVLEYALPILAEFSARATLYLVADRLGSGNDWETAQGEVPAPLMDPSEVREWLAAGQQIGSHTLTHPWLTRVPITTVREEIRASRRKLEDLFGVPVVDFCYPYGDWNIPVHDEVIAAGYQTAVTTALGVNGPETDPWALRRLTARRATRGWRRVRALWRRLWRR